MTHATRDQYDGAESVAETSTLCLKESFAELFRCWEAAVERSSETSEHVHELRVASRRTAAALKLFANWLPRRKTDRLLRKLDELRKSAGPARDCDVFAERISKTTRKAKTPRKEGVQQFTEQLRAQRTAAQQSLAEFYEQCERGEEFERRAVELVSALRPRRPKQDGNILFNEWVPRQLRSEIRDFFDESDVDTKRLERLHEFRIRAKQLRYCLDILGPALDADRFKKAYAGLKKLSQRLGDINDHATAIETLSRWIDAEFDAQSMHTLRQWRKDERRSLRRAIAKYAKWWTSRRQRQLRRKLKQAAKTTAPVTAGA